MTNIVTILRIRGRNNINITFVAAINICVVISDLYDIILFKSFVLHHPIDQDIYQSKMAAAQRPGGQQAKICQFKLVLLGET